MSSNIKNLLTAKAISAVAIPAAIVASGALVWSGSTAAFSGVTSNEDNTWQAGTITLQNDRATALFSASGITPGYAEEQCITVSSSSDIPTTLKMYTEGVTGTGTPTTLPQNLNVEVVAGSGSLDAACTGFLAALQPAVFQGTLADFGAVNNYSNGVGASQLPAGDSSAQYKITLSLPSDAPNSLQGTTASANFVWEAQG